MPGLPNRKRFAQSQNQEACPGKQSGIRIKKLLKGVRNGHGSGLDCAVPPVQADDCVKDGLPDRLLELAIQRQAIETCRRPQHLGLQVTADSVRQVARVLTGSGQNGYGA